MDHLDENPNYYTNLKKVETKESMGADSAGAFEPAFNAPIVKRKIDKIHNLESDLDEATDASSSLQHPRTGANSISQGHQQSTS